MTEKTAKRLADKYHDGTPGHWCRIYYAAQLLIDWCDVRGYVSILRE